MELEHFLDDTPPTRPHDRLLRKLSHWHDHGRDPRDPVLLAPKQNDNTHITRPTGAGSAFHALRQSVIRMGGRSTIALAQVMKSAVLRDPINDREDEMEKMMQAVIKDGEHRTSEWMTQFFVKTLWGDLQHPAEGLMTAEYKFRKPDGSNNNLLFPLIGAAGQPYARSAKPMAGQSAVLPDPELIFETLLRRREAKPHPGGLSSMLPYLATIIIHDVFKTDHEDANISRTSSYLDLAPLYGSSAKDLERVRTFQDGKLKPDCFSETRMLVLPPGSGILLIMFNRFHNRVADQLVQINEGGRFDMPKRRSDWTQAKYEQKCKDREEEIFQTARLITGGLYVNIILIDYVRTILNLNRTDSNWQLDPRVEIPNGPKPGVGNQVSAEFNLVYRWHGVVSERDTRWTERQFESIFGDVDPAKIEQKEFLKTLGHMEVAAEAADPMERRFGHLDNLERQPNGYYKDDELAKMLVDSCEDVACAFGARGTPSVLKQVEILGMQQSRKWNLATLNEFRKHFGLKPHKTFREINRDPKIAEALEHLYKHPDNVELAIGMTVEETKPPLIPGSGLCPGYTAGRAILADAVALVRGDRFHTTSYHPRVLTNWGFGEAGYNTHIDNGCNFYKLFQRSLPNQLHPDSIYSHFPMTLASETRKAYNGDLQFKSHLYDLTRPDTTQSRKPYIVRTHASAQSLLQRTKVSKVDLSLILALLWHEKKAEHNEDREHSKHVFTTHTQQLEQHLIAGPSSTLREMPRNLMERLCEKFESVIEGLIKQKSYPLTDFREVDIVADVVRKATVELTAELFGIPFGKHESDDCSIDTLHQIFSTIAATWSNFDSVTLTGMRQQASHHVPKLWKSMHKEMERLHSKLSGDHRRRSSALDDAFKIYRTDFLADLFKAGLDADQAFAATIILASSFATNISRHFAELLDQLLQTENVETGDSVHLDAIQATGNKQTFEADNTFNIYTRELLRLSSEAVTTRVLTHDFTLDGTPHKSGQHVLISARVTNMDAGSFSDPTKLDTSREAATYLPFDMTFGAQDKVWQDLHLGCLRSLMKVVIARRPRLQASTIWDGESKRMTLKKVAVRFDLPEYERTEVNATHVSSYYDPEAKAEQGNGNTEFVAHLPNGSTNGTTRVETELAHANGQLKTNWEADQEGKIHGHAAGLVANLDMFGQKKGKQGKWTLKETKEEVLQMVYLNENWDSYAAFPCNLKIKWFP